MKKIYLDWADLQDFIDGKFSSELTSLIKKNWIIISPMHLSECFVGEPDKVRLRAKKLNDIASKKYVSIARRLAVWEPLAWFQSNGVVLNLEDEFFAPTYFRAVSSEHWAIQRPDDIPAFYEECLQVPSMMKFFQDIRLESIRSAVRLGNDRRMISKQKAEKNHENIIEQRLDQCMFETFGEAIFAIQLLTGRPPANFRAFPEKLKYQIGSHIIGSHQLRKIMNFEKLMNELNIARSLKYSKQAYTSRNFQKHGSAMGDSIHLSVMPLVDVFTCDTPFFQLLNECPSFGFYRNKVFTKTDKRFEAQLIHKLSN